MKSSHKPYSYYRNLSLVNFRGFKKQENIPLAPLTILVGPNSSGKSSICNALLLLAQSDCFPVFNESFKPAWIGQLVDLGSFEDAIYGHKSTLTMRIGAELVIDPKAQRWGSPASKRQSIIYEFQIRGGRGDSEGHISKIDIMDRISRERLGIHVDTRKERPSIILEFLGLSAPLRPEKFPEEARPYTRTYALVAHQIDQTLRRRRKPSMRGRQAGWDRIKDHLRASSAYSEFTAQTQRVSSDRAAPKRVYSRIGPGQPEGTDGPWRTQRVYEAVDPNMLGDDRVGRVNRKEISRILQKLNVAKDISRGELSPYYFDIKLTDNRTKIESRIIDFGYGASQVIPIIVACTSDANGPLIIEQPEIHLHPMAQGVIAELLGQSSARRQVVMETHSVHMINRIRLMIAEKKIDHGDVVINYIDRTARGSRVTTIPLKPNGDFGAEWPGGFFDERYQDTMALVMTQINSGNE